ncbi:response regulator [Thiolapillus sp.]|uniref:response regulator n=1 Tax=Thiolapillus sp. TaxID=2017437 RepID=UPI003AF74E63
MKTRILVIEDDALLNRMIVRQLEGMGYEVAGMGSLGDARDYLKKYEPDLVISDMRLPDGDCLAALPALAEFHPVIVLTAYFYFVIFPHPSADRILWQPVVAGVALE